MLTAEDFHAFFEGVHGRNVTPFPWQARLVRHVVESGEWPRVLDLPTGVGKTAAMDIALFHLAVELERGGQRRAPMRIAFVVDRRLVVDDAFTRACKLAFALESSKDSDGVVARVASALRTGGGADAPALVARRLRGGMPREDDWARSPAQPTILCSTVDQVGSRLLFRGYGVSDSMKPVHAGLLGADCLILLDEAHLAEPFRQTLSWVERYRGRSWREVDDTRPWGVALLSATPGPDVAASFALDEDDYTHPVLSRRLNARKPARLVLATRKRKRSTASATDHTRAEDEEREMTSRASAICEEVADALVHFSDPAHGAARPAIGVVVNRVARARAIFDRLKNQHEDADVRLLVGPARPIDRDHLAEVLAPIRTGADRQMERPLIIVATQCIEAGVDIDLDALITEAAALDAIRQRFGRLNRDGRDVSPFASILAWKVEVSARYDDPVYDKAIKAAWDRLYDAAVAGDDQRVVEMGIQGFNVTLEAETLARKGDAPVLLPVYLDLLSQTSPIPAADPEVGFFLHGMRREPDAVGVVWRADINGTESREGVRRLLSLVPPRAPEAISLPVWAVRQWLSTRRGSALGDLADTPTVTPDREGERESDVKTAFRWRGDDPRSEWIPPSEVRPGDTLVVPARYGGVDSFGWNPTSEEPATDVAAAAGVPFRGRRVAIRVADGLLGTVHPDVLRDALAGADSRRWEDLRAALLALELPEELRQDLMDLDRARRRRVVAYVDAYPSDRDGRNRGVVFVAPLGILDVEGTDVGAASTEDDVAGSLTGLPIPLEDHGRRVGDRAAMLAQAAGLSAIRQGDLRVAGLLHDVGKADPRCQAWLHYGDPLGPDLTESMSVLAKSGRDLPPSARTLAGLPDRWRHEALSVRLAPRTAVFAEANDPDLVLWLIGTHHGYGRSLFPHEDPADALPREIPIVFDLPGEVPSGNGPQSLAFEWNGADWPTLHERLRARYGTWDLALMEAVLRLADHRVSEQESSRTQ